MALVWGTGMCSAMWFWNVLSCYCSHGVSFPLHLQFAFYFASNATTSFLCFLTVGTLWDSRWVLPLSHPVVSSANSPVCVCSLPTSASESQCGCVPFLATSRALTAQWTSPSGWPVSPPGQHIETQTPPKSSLCPLNALLPRPQTWPWPGPWSFYCSFLALIVDV